MDPALFIYSTLRSTLTVARTKDLDTAVSEWRREEKKELRRALKKTKEIVQWERQKGDVKEERKKDDEKRNRCWSDNLPE